MIQRSKWRIGTRVLVKACGRDGEFRLSPAVTGTIVRLLRRDDSAWIALAERQRDECHPFAADDKHGRGTHVLSWPDLCFPARLREIAGGEGDNRA